MTNVNEPHSLFDVIESYLSQKKLTLTKREYYAGLAMQGMMSLDPREMLSMADPKCGTVGQWIALNCVSMADALIVELSKSK